MSKTAKIELLNDAMVPCFPTVINHALPNVAAFMRTVLKREKLSDEAEHLRARYEENLNALEHGRHPPRPVSFVGDDDSGYFSANRPRGGKWSVGVLCYLPASASAV